MSGIAISPNTQAQNLKYHHQFISGSVQPYLHHISDCAVCHHPTCCRLTACHLLSDYYHSFQTGLLTSALVLLWSEFHTLGRVTSENINQTMSLPCLRLFSGFPPHLKCNWYPSGGRWGGRWEGGLKGRDTCTPMTDSCWCMAETNTIL